MECQGKSQSSGGEIKAQGRHQEAFQGRVSAGGCDLPEGEEQTLLSKIRACLVSRNK